MVASLENRIIDNVVTTLEGIDGTGSWHVNVAKVARMEGNMAADMRAPGIAVVHDGSRLSEKALASFRYQLGLVLSLVLSGDAVDWDEQLGDFASDCQAALQADWTRGGLALNTTVQTVEVFDAAPGTPYVVAELGVEIDYRTDPDDPTSLPYQ